MPDRSARAEPEAGGNLHAAVEFAGFVPPTVLGVYTVVLTQGLGIGHFTDLPLPAG